MHAHQFMRVCLRLHIYVCTYVLSTYVWRSFVCLYTVYTYFRILERVCVCHSKELSYPTTDLDRPWRFQEVEAPRFQENWHMKVVRLSALRIRQKIFLVFISVRAWINPRAIVRPKGIWQWKIPMTQSGIESATLCFVAQCFNQLLHRDINHSNNEITTTTTTTTTDMKICQYANKRYI